MWPICRSPFIRNCLFLIQGCSWRQHFWRGTCLHSWDQEGIQSLSPPPSCTYRRQVERAELSTDGAADQSVQTHFFILWTPWPKIMTQRSVTQRCELDPPRQTRLTCAKWRSWLFMSYIWRMPNQGTNMLKCHSGKLLEIWRNVSRSVYEKHLRCECPSDSCPGLKRASLCLQKVSSYRSFPTVFNLDIYRGGSQAIIFYSPLCLHSFPTNHWEVLRLQGRKTTAVFFFFSYHLK